ncbi:MAG TPA: CDP-alcohol phosphatidyltransferase family protein [Thermomicrobiales bacterium]|nr:CDP-alcohol phosphatidyltransferase family protein [Thermomicrobiales bacterium]
MVSTRFAERVRVRLSPLGRIVARTHLTPNAITIIGLGLNVGVAAVIATGNLVLGGVLVLLAGGFDALDGAVARVTGQTSDFGGFLDSTLDRYSEAVVFGGLLVYLTRTDAGTVPIVLTYVTIVGSLMISYSRSRAEAIGIRGDIGFAQRLERVIILAIALIVSQPVWGLWVLAIATQLTALHRILHVWRVTRQPGGER